MIQQKLGYMESLIPVIDKLNAGGFKTSDEIVSYLHLFSDLSIGFIVSLSTYKYPLEIEERINLLLQYAECNLSQKEYSSCDIHAIRIKEKSENMLFKIVLHLKNNFGNKFRFVSFETFKKICAFYSKIENLPKHEKELQILCKFFQQLYYWDQNEQLIPAWLNKETEVEVRSFLLNPIIISAISYIDDVSLAYIVCCGLPSLDKDDFLKKLDYYARGIFRTHDSFKSFDGPNYSSEESYENIIGQETVDPYSSSEIVVRAAQLAHMIKK